MRKQYLGVYPPRSRSDKDVQIKSIICNWHSENPHVDHATSVGAIGLIHCAKHKFPWSPVWFGVWLWLYVLHRHITVQRLTISGGLGFLKFLAPPEWALRWIEKKLNLLGRLPHYVSVDQKTYGRFGVLPSTSSSAENGLGLGYVGSSQRLGP